MFKLAPLGKIERGYSPLPDRRSLTLKSEHNCNDEEAELLLDLPQRRLAGAALAEGRYRDGPQRARLQSHPGDAYPRRQAAYGGDKTLDRTMGDAAGQFRDGSLRQQIGPQLMESVLNKIVTPPGNRTKAGTEPGPRRVSRIIKDRVGAGRHVSFAL